MTNLRIFLALVAISMLIGCGANKKKDHYQGMSADQIYAMAEKNLKKENYAQAIKDYEALESHHPYTEYSDKSQLALINAYYKKNEPALAISAADRFIRINPRHPRVDYAYYLKGLVNFDQNTTPMYRYLPVDRSLRDPKNAEESFEAFKTLLEQFPNSEYAEDARKRMVYLRDQLANHEMGVIDYYMKRGAYLSAANRANYIIKVFPNTSATPKALCSLVQAYRLLGMKDLAEDALTTLQQNFPNSQELKSVY